MIKIVKEAVLINTTLKVTNIIVYTYSIYVYILTLFIDMMKLTILTSLVIYCSVGNIKLRFFSHSYYPIRTIRLSGPYLVLGRTKTNLSKPLYFP